jgi:hypothetical protein
MALSLISHNVPKPVIRVIAAVGFVVTFFVVASVIDPGSSTATSPGEAPLLIEEQPTPGVLMGVLQGQNYTVQIFAGADEPLYTVFDIAGRTVATGITQDELYRIDPELDLRDAQSLQMMQVDIDDDR